MSEVGPEFREITLNHANLNTEVKVRVGAIGGYHFSEKAQCTYLYTIAGVFPVKETSNDIKNLIGTAAKEN